MSAKASVVVLEESGRLRKRRCRHCGKRLLIPASMFRRALDAPSPASRGVCEHRVKGIRVLELIVPCNGATFIYEGYPNRVLWLELKVRQQIGGRRLHDAKGYASFSAFP